MRTMVLLLAVGCTSSNGVPPMAQPDLAKANADMGGATDDLSPALDLASGDLPTPPPNLSKPIWIGSGGSARSGNQQLNVQIGRGGTSVAPSGARFSNGYFSDLLE